MRRAQPRAASANRGSSITCRTAAPISEGPASVGKVNPAPLASTRSPFIVWSRPWLITTSGFPAASEAMILLRPP